MIRTRRDSIRLLAFQYNHGYTEGMKTAISIPDPIFESAEVLAKQLKLSRSELYVRAIEEFLRSNNDSDITRRLNEVYASEDSTLDPVLNQMQMRSLPSEEW